MVVGGGSGSGKLVWHHGACLCSAGVGNRGQIRWRLRAMGGRWTNAQMANGNDSGNGNSNSIWTGRLFPILFFSFPLAAILACFALLCLLARWLDRSFPECLSHLPSVGHHTASSAHSSLPA
jgi:hypothetical protein